MYRKKVGVITPHILTFENMGKINGLVFIVPQYSV